MTDTPRLDLAAIRARCDAATEGPWGGYATIASGPLAAAHDQWVEPLLSSGHTLERSGTCPDCPGQRVGCAYARDAYLRDPVVASVPAWAGGTPTGRHAADVAFIANARSDVPALVAEVERLRAAIDELNAAIGFEVTCLSCAGTLAGAAGETARAERAEAERDALRAALAALRMGDGTAPGTAAGRALTAADGSGVVQEPRTAPEALGTAEGVSRGPNVTVTRYTVSLFPPGHPEAGCWDVDVEWRGNDRWAVVRGKACYATNGTRDWETGDSTGEAGWRAAHWLPLDEALSLARRVASTIRINGWTAADALAGVETMEADQ